MTKELQQTELAYKGFPVLLDQANNLIVHGQQTGDKIQQTPSYVEKLAAQTKKAGSFKMAYKDDEYIIVYNTLASTNWKVATVYKQSDLNTAAYSVLNIVVIMALMTFIIVATFII